jgi:hypothetical protein
VPHEGYHGLMGGDAYVVALLWPACGQQRFSLVFQGRAPTATTSGNLSQSHSIDALTGFPKPRAAGSIPAEGTEEVRRSHGRFLRSPWLCDGPEAASRPH